MRMPVSLIATLGLAAAITMPAPVQGQTRGAAGTQPAVQAPVVPLVETNAGETRQALDEVMQKYPPGLGRVLKTDPTLLTNAEYLSRYPALAAFLTAHPEIAHNPAYYLAHIYIAGDDPEPVDAQSRALRMWRDTFEAVSVFLVMIFVASMLAWLVKTVLDHRRWLRLSRVQTEVHTKLLDRFTGTGDLLAWAQTPAGRRFLEAAPLATDHPRSMSAPLGRILWSVQVGVVLAIGGIGFQFVSGRVMPEVADGLWTIGVLALAFGVGFVLSGAISYMLSRRLGLLEPIEPSSGMGDQGSAV